MHAKVDLNTRWTNKATDKIREGRTHGTIDHHSEEVGVGA